VDIGSLQNLAIVSLTDPRINDSFLSGGVDVQKATRNFLDFDRTMTGAGGSLGYPLEPLLGAWAQDIQSSIRYDHTQVNIRNIRSSAALFVQQSAGYSTVSAFTPQLSRNTIDNPLNPTKGVRQVFSVEVAGFGGDQKYMLVSALNQWFQPLVDLGNGPIVFSLRTRLDYGESSNGKPLPLFRRFFPGGINSVRGFRNRTMGPVDLQGNRYGGSKEFVNNAELIFPLLKAAGLNGVVFYDIGQAFDDKKSITFSELRGAYGGGIRWSSPMGPIRIEFGFPTEIKPGERSMVTLFSFGAPL
jgi:outer membrane protein insertion porin family